MSAPTLNEQSEKWLVGALLADPSLITQARDLNPLDLFDNVLRTIFRTQLGIHAEGKVPTLTSVAQRMEADGTLADVDGGLGLLGLSNDAPYVSHVAEWCDGIQRAAMRRRLRSVALTISGMADDPGVDDEMLLAQFEAAKQQLVTGENRPRFKWAGELMDEFPEMSPAILEGLLRCGETMNIIAAPKTGKSWLSMGLGLSVVSGRKWLDRFWTRRGKVLIVDNELNPRTSADRLPRIAEAMGIQRDEYAGCLAVKNLRGQLIDLKSLSAQLIELEAGAFSLIVLDAWYRFQPIGSDENSNGDVAQLYNLLDSVANKLGSAFVCIHHTSKGNQSGKGVTDVGSGAGAQSRAPDSHLTMRLHEEDNAVVVEAAVRSFAPMEPFCLRWNFPVWTPADDLDPKDLRQERPRKPKGTATESGESSEDLRKQRDAESRQKVLDAYQTFPTGETKSTIREAAGMSGAVFGPINAALIREGVVSECKVTKNRCEYPGFCLTNSRRSDNPDNSDKQASCPTCPTEGGVHSRTSVSPLGDAVSPICPPPSDASAVGKSELKNLSDLTEINHELADELFPVEAA